MGGVGGFGAMLGGAVAGRGGGAAGRGAMLDGGAAGDAVGAGVAAVFLRGAAFRRGAAFFADDFLRAVLRRAVFALRAVFFFAPALRRFAAGLARRFAALRAEALRRFAVFLVARDAFLRPDRLDFDLDPERAIKPPVTGLEVAAFRVALQRHYSMQEETRFVKAIAMQIPRLSCRNRAKVPTTRECARRAPRPFAFLMPIDATPTVPTRCAEGLARETRRPTRSRNRSVRARE